MQSRLKLRYPITRYQFSALVILALAACNIALLMQNRILRIELAEALNVGSLREGDPLLGFSATGLDNSTIRVEYGAGIEDWILLYFSPTCPWCDQQMRLWKDLRSRCAECQILGLVSDRFGEDQIRRYLSSHGFDSLQVARVDQDTLSSYRLHATPITLIVSGAGTVRRSWSGLWPDDVYPARVLPYLQTPRAE